VTPPQRNSPLVKYEMNVARRRSVEVNLLVRPIGVDRRRRFDDLDIKTASKGLEVREDELAWRFDMGCWEYFSKLRDAERDEDTYNASVMAKVQIEVLVYWKGDGVVIKGDVDLSGRGSDDVVLHASEDFFNVAWLLLARREIQWRLSRHTDANSSANRRAEPCTGLE